MAEIVWNHIAMCVQIHYRYNAVKHLTLILIQLLVNLFWSNILNIYFYNALCIQIDIVYDIYTSHLNVTYL